MPVAIGPIGDALEGAYLRTSRMRFAAVEVLRHPLPKHHVSDGSGVIKGKAIIDLGTAHCAEKGTVSTEGQGSAVAEQAAAKVGGRS